MMKMKTHNASMQSAMLLILLLNTTVSVFSQRRHIEHKPINDLAMISNDLKYASTNGTDGYGFIWDLETGRPIHSIGPIDGPNAQIFINPEGTMKLIRSGGKISISPILDSTVLHTYPDSHINTILGIAKGTGHIIYLDTLSYHGKHNLWKMELDGKTRDKLLEFSTLSNYVNYQRTDYYTPDIFYRLVDDNTHIIYYNFAKNGKLYDFSVKKYAVTEVKTGKSKGIDYSDKEGYKLNEPFFYNGSFLVSENSNEEVRLTNSSGVAFYEKGSPYIGKFFSGNYENLSIDQSADGSMIVAVNLFSNYSKTIGIRENFNLFGT